MGELLWEEMKRAEPISSSQVAKLKVCDPITSQVGQAAGHYGSWQREWELSTAAGKCDSAVM